VYVGVCLTYQTGFSMVLFGAKELSQGTLPGVEVLYPILVHTVCACDFVVGKPWLKLSLYLVM